MSEVRGFRAMEDFDESRINLNHPKQLFDAEEHERKNKKGLSLYK